MKCKLSMLACVAALLISGCATTPPQNPENICEIFEEKRDWYEAAVATRERWGAPVHIPMAIMYQESSFRSDAAPPMEYFLWVIPIGRASDAYGYSQAKTPTWADYVRESGNSGASRTDFDDAIDFMGWFIFKTQKVNNVSKWDAYNQYLNYHEGWGGFKRKTYNKKPWLKKVAGKVKRQSQRYQRQLKTCKANLDDATDGWF